MHRACVAMNCEGRTLNQARPDAIADWCSVRRHEADRTPQENLPDPIMANTKGHSGQGSLLRVADLLG
eukprot:9489322-Pyramimonas_sp.AAC.1